MQKIDFDALTEEQRDVLGLLAINRDIDAKQLDILDELVKKDLVEAEDITQDMSLLIGNRKTATHYYVPLHVHIQWCNWCSENYRDEVGDFKQ